MSANMAKRRTPTTTSRKSTRGGTGDTRGPKREPRVDPHPPSSRPRGGVDPVRGEQGVIDGACHPGSEVPALG